MFVSVKLSGEVVEEAKRYGGIYHRSPSKQIEYWFKVGKIAEQNPDLTFAFIQEILIAQEQAKNHDVLAYKAQHKEAARKALDELTHMSEELGLYENES